MKLKLFAELRHAITMACGVSGKTKEEQKESWKEVAKIAIKLSEL